MAEIGLLGAGTWGMALARMLSNNGNEVTVFSVVEKEIDELNATRKLRNLPYMDIPEEIVFTKDKKTVTENVDVLLLAVPSVFVRSTTSLLREDIRDGQIIVDVAKGMEAETTMAMSEVILDEIRKDGLHDHVEVVALSGPTHAEEVAIDLPTTIVSACEDEQIARYVQDVFTSRCMRVYTNSDKKGVELCGALKNIVALASGISAGLGYGDNAKAAIITRGLVEIRRLGLKMGCREQTFSGLAGMGDLIVTATSEHSRNNRAGYLIGQGKSPEEAVKEVGMVVEGINALPAAMKLAEAYQVEMPICEAVNEIITHNASPKDIVYQLMNRSRKDEVIYYV